MFGRNVDTTPLVHRTDVNGPSDISVGGSGPNDMTSESGGLRRRDVLRTGAGVGLLGFVSLTATGASTNRRAGSGQTQRARNAFSFSLQESDRFRVRFRPRDSAGNPATVSIPSNCFDGGGSREYRMFIVRAYKGQIELGFRGLFVPGEAEGTTTETTEVTETTETTETEGEPTTSLADTATDGTTASPDETPTDETPTEAAFQDETTTEAETATTGETTTETTPDEGPALPEIRVGEWYRVTSSVRCSSLYRLTLESIAGPETTLGEAEQTESEETETTETEAETTAVETGTTETAAGETGTAVDGTTAETTEADGTTTDT